MHRLRTRKRRNGPEDGRDRRPSDGSQTSSPPSSSGKQQPTYSRWRRAPSPSPKPDLNLATALPTNDDFRTSLLMSGLSARFSMLREQDDPNSILGKASDDSVLSPRRASRLNMDFRARSDLSDIEEVASIHGSIRPPFRSAQSESAQADGYGTDDDINYRSNHSVLDRPRMAEGNMLFGGRQKIYKIAPGNNTGRQLYDHDVSHSTFQKHRQAEKQRKEALKLLGDGRSSPPAIETRALSRPSEEYSPADSQRRSRDTSSSTNSHPSNATQTSTAATSVTSGTPVSATNAAPPNNGSFMRPNSPTFANNNGHRPRRYEQNLDQQLLEKQTSKTSMFEMIPKPRPSQMPAKPPSAPPESTLQPPSQSFGSKSGRSFKNLAISTQNQKDVEPAMPTPASVNSQSETDGERLLTTVPKSPPSTAIRISGPSRPRLNETLGRPPSKPDSYKSSTNRPSFIDVDPNPGTRLSSGAGLRGMVAQHMRQDSGASSVYTQATGPARSPRFGPSGGMDFLGPGSRNTMASNASGGTRRFDMDEWDIGYMGERDSMSSGTAPSHHRSLSRQMDTSRLIPERLDVSTIGIANGDTPQPTPTSHVRDTSSVSTATQKEQEEFIGELKNARQRVQQKMKSYHEAGSPNPNDDNSPALPIDVASNNAPRLPKQASKGSLRTGGSKAMKMLGIDADQTAIEQHSRPPTADARHNERNRSTSDASRNPAESPRSPLEALKHTFSRAQENLSNNQSGRSTGSYLDAGPPRPGPSHPSSSVSATTDSSTFSRFRNHSRNASPGSMTQASVDGSSSSQKGRRPIESNLQSEHPMGTVSIQRPAPPPPSSPLSPFSASNGPNDRAPMVKRGSDSRTSSPQLESSRFAGFMRRDRKRSINKSAISDPVLVSRTTERMNTIDLRGAIENSSDLVSDDVMKRNLIPIEQASGGRASPAPFHGRPSVEAMMHPSGRASPALSAFENRIPPAIPPMDPRRQRPSPTSVHTYQPNEPRLRNPQSSSSISTTASRSAGRPSTSRDGPPPSAHSASRGAPAPPQRHNTDPIAGVPYALHTASKPPAIVNSIKPPSMEKYKHNGPRSPMGHPYSSASMYANVSTSNLNPPHHDRYNSSTTSNGPSSPRSLSRQGNNSSTSKQDWSREFAYSRPAHPSHSGIKTSASAPAAASAPPLPPTPNKRTGAFRNRGAESRERDRNDVNKRSENLWGRLKKSTSDGGGLSSRARAESRRSSRERRDQRRREENESFARALRGESEAGLEDGVDMRNVRALQGL